MFSEHQLIEFFAGYAYQPSMVYSFICLFMMASSFGLPIPEEVILISAGLVAYMARNPSEYPPPFEGAEGVNVITLAIVCFCAVLLSDIIIYCIGRFFGSKLLETTFFKKRFGEEQLAKVDKWYQKYSSWMCGAFRFMPGIRFPGHLSCGMLKISFWKFVLIDGLAALISGTTHVLIVSQYGEIILTKIREFKMYVLIVIGLLLLIYFVRKFFFTKKKEQSTI